MTSNSTIEETSRLENGSQNETGEYTIHTLLPMHVAGKNRKKMEDLTLISIISKVSSPSQTVKCINIESKIYSANKNRSVCHLAPRLVRNMHHLKCVLVRVCKFQFLGTKTFFLFQFCWFSYIYKLDDLPSVAFHLKGHLTSALKTLSFKNSAVQFSCVFMPPWPSLVNISDA